jgi:glucokinase
MALLLLSVDAGGTTVRFRLSAKGEGIARPVAECRRPSAGWDAFEEDLARFLGSEPVRSVLGEGGIVGERRAGFALAGVVYSGALAGGVTRWGAEDVRDMEALAADHGFRCAAVLNDMEAASLAAFNAPQEAVVPLDGGGAPRLGRFVHLRPGTGLGVGVWLAGRSIPSEGGNAPCAFDCADADELAAQRALASESGRFLPSYETALCGTGLAILAWLFSRIETTPEDVLAEARADRRFRREVDLYARLLGRAAQAAALAVLPDACVLSGPVVNALPEWAFETALREFRRHGALAPILARVRVVKVLAEDLPLIGAELAAEQRGVRELS